MKYCEKVPSKLENVLRETKAEVDEQVEQAAAAIRAQFEHKIEDLRRSLPADRKGNVENVKDLHVDVNGNL